MDLQRNKFHCTLSPSVGYSIEEFIINNVVFPVKQKPPKIMPMLHHSWPAGLGNAVDCILFQFPLKGNHEQRLPRLYAVETLMPNQ